MFFFEKKKQKTFTSWRVLLKQRATACKSFLLLFFKKEALAFMRVNAVFASMPRRQRCTILLFFLLLGTLPVLGGHVRYAGSDAKGVTVVAQQILQTGHLSLEGRFAAFFNPNGGVTDRRTVSLNGHVEYFFPLGPVLVSMPFVAAESLMGVDFAGRKADWKLQQVLVLGVAFLILAFLCRLLRKAFSPVTSFLLSLGFFYGSLLAPTIAGAFWSLDCEMVATGIVVLLVWEGRCPLGSRRALLLGVALFCGFLCRPTFATIIAPIFLYLGLRDRRAFYLSASASAVLLGAYVMFSEVHYGSYLPPYYLASRLTGSSVATAFRGLLVSPSRGVIVFCPFLVMLLFYGRFVARSHNPSLLKCLGLAMLLQFLSCITFPMWWGGESFGPRILANFSFVGCMILSGLLAGLTHRERAHAALFLAAAVSIGMCINLPGLLSDYTRLWDEFPTSDAHPEVFFDWRFPQFLSLSKSRLIEKCLDQAKTLHFDARGSCPG